MLYPMNKMCFHATRTYAKSGCQTNVCDALNMVSFT